MTSLVHAVVILLPVITFLCALVLLDSYKLVSMRLVVGVVACGALVALASYHVNGAILEATDLDIRRYIRYVAPIVEEALKALVLIALVMGHRVGFLVDAAILGFAAGAGFAAVENIHYLQAMPDAGLGTWIVRGFGTAIMHGGATAIFGVAGVAMVDRAGKASFLAFVPGFLVAVLLHSGFNHLLGTPKLATLAILLVLPPLFVALFRASERAVGRWLGTGFDADAEMLQLINSGQLTDSPLGQYLTTLRGRFEGMVVADLLSYLRLYTELAMRAKGILMMRENGFDPPIDESTRERFAEMRYLEKSIGPTGLRAIQPMLRMSHKDLWQLYMLGK